MNTSWQYGRFQTTTSTGGKPGTQWKDIDVPKENSISLTGEKGETLELKDERGQIVDSFTKANVVRVEFELFIKKGTPQPWTNKDGLIEGEHALRYQPLDATANGFQIDRCSLSCETTYTVADGFIVKYTATALVPFEGEVCKIKPITIV